MLGTEFTNVIPNDHKLEYVNRIYRAWDGKVILFSSFQTATVVLNCEKCGVIYSNYRDRNYRPHIQLVEDYGNNAGMFSFTCPKCKTRWLENHVTVTDKYPGVA